MVSSWLVGGLHTQTRKTFTGIHLLRLDSEQKLRRQHAGTDALLFNQAARSYSAYMQYAFILRLVYSIWSMCQSEETITRRLQTEINSVHEKILLTQLKLHSVCSTGTWDPQMHNSWRPLPKLFDLQSFSHNLYPLTIPLDCKSCFVLYIYIYIPMNVQKLNHDDINKYWTMPQSCSTLLGICHAETSRAGTPGSVNWKYSRACGPFEVTVHPQTSHVCTYMTDVAAQEGKKKHYNNTVAAFESIPILIV